MLQAGILRLCVLQGFVGFVAVGHAQAIITVNQSGGANCTSITQAVAAAAGILARDPQHVTIEVLDSGPYYESVYITQIPTSSSATLTLVGAPGRTTIFAPRAAITCGFKPTRPIHIGRTDFVTVSGFIFQNDLTGCTEADAMTGINFDSYAPSDSQITFDNCVWDGQDQTYDFKAILFCWQPHCNITVQNSTFENIVVGTDLSVVYVGGRSMSMKKVPTFTFSGNRVINNSNPEVQIEGNPAGRGYYHKIVIQDNEFTGNTGQYDLLSIRNQRAGCDIHNNRFYGNTNSGRTLALLDSGNAHVTNNRFVQNGAVAEVLVQASATGTTVLTGNTIAASEGPNFGVWADLGGSKLQSSGNRFYSNYDNDSTWNELTDDYVAYWAAGKGQKLTISQWNAKTPKDGNDSWGDWPPTP